LEHTLGHAKPAEFVLPVAVLSVGLALVGILLAWLLYGRKPQQTSAQADPLAKLGVLYKGAERKWLVDELYHAIIIKPIKWLADIFAGPVDQRGIDGVVNGAGAVTSGLAGILRKMQTGYVRTYALWMVIGGAILLAVLLVR
jgi:NADH-quinone oxidoreductase subunit L